MTSQHFFRQPTTKTTMLSLMLSSKWSYLSLSITVKRPMVQQVVAIRHSTHSQRLKRRKEQQQRRRHWNRSVSACFTIIDCETNHPVSSYYRQLTSRWISEDRDVIETSPDSSLSSLSLKEEGKDEGETNKELLKTATFTSPMDDDPSCDDTKTLLTLLPDDYDNKDDDDDEETSLSPSNITIVDMNIPGRDSQVIMVSDHIIDMVQQNSELIKASFPILEESESNEPLIGAVPLITYEGKETYFQFDYRNHPPIVDIDIQNLLRKIERVLRNIHLEPLGNYNRGVETMAMNIENMKEGEDYRISRRTYKKTGLFEPIHEEKPKATRFTLLKTLTERHALYATGNNPRFGSLDWNVLGQSLFGPDSEVEVKASDTAIILRDLWCYGNNTMFNGLQRRHFAMKRRKEEKQLKKILDEEMKHLPYPEPLVQHMVKVGRMDVVKSTAKDDDNSIPLSDTKARRSPIQPRPSNARSYRNR